ncbi:MAG: PD-(D/E)XK nuclease family protein [Lachnospiraceae bacterium]|nr:PD-(D/E)XK nuclease family protein [Lachnospiraceae bacterium]
MGLRFCLGGSGSGKSSIVYEEIVKRSMAHPEQDFLIIVPDQFTLQTQKELCRIHPRGGIMNIDVLSFSRLAHRIFDEVYVEEKTVLDDTGKNLIIRSVAAQNIERLTVIGGQLKKIGYIHEVKSVISEFMQYDIRISDLQKMIDQGTGHGRLQAKLKDLAIIYAAFLDYIKDTYVTTEERLDILRGVLKRSGLIRRSTVVFDGFTGFTPVQNKLIQEILRLSREVIVTLDIDPREDPYVIDGEHKLFYLTKKTIASLTRLAEEVDVVRGEDMILRETVVKRYANNAPLAHLEQNVFRFAQRPYEEKTSAIQVFSAKNLKEEAQRVCLSIRRLLREEGYCFRDIAVVTGSLEMYGELLSRECKRYDIPYFMDQNLGLMFHPMVNQILGALEVLRARFSYESVFHYLRSGLCDLTMEEIDDLENYVRSLGIRGRESYVNQFVRRPLHSGDEEAARRLEELNGIRERFMESLSPLMTLQEKNRGCAYVDAIYDFCVANRLQQKLEEYAELFEQQGEAAKAKEYRQVYRLAMDLLDQIHELLGQQTPEFKDFIEILTAGFSELKVSTIPPNIDQIVIGDIERTRLKEIKALFFVGVGDGIIPKSGGGGGLISDLDREFLQACGYEMAPTVREQMFIQKLYLYINMTKPAERLCLSYSQTDSEGRTLRPSYLIEEICRLFPKVQIYAADESDLAGSIETKEDGYDDLALCLGRYAAGQLSRQEDVTDFFDLLKLYRSDERVASMVDAAFMQYRPQPLTARMAQALYGEVLRNSVSRLEKFAGCAYAHFVKYGLKLLEDDEFRFESVDMGTIFHDMLARFGKFLEERGETFLNFEHDVMVEFTKKTLEEVAVQYGGTVLYSSARNAFVIRRMERILIRTFQTLQYQLRKGSFLPAYYEVPFEIMSSLQISGDKQMRIVGKIDRVDKVEKDGNTYLKIIDYKSGNNKFDPVSLYYGTQMQLAVYLHAALLREKREMEQKGADGEVIPAAILYYHMNDPFLPRERETVDEVALEAQRMRAMRMDGLVNEDETCVTLLDQTFSDHSDVIPVERKKSGEYTAFSAVASTKQLQTMADFAAHKMRTLGEEILCGNKQINPYESAEKSACTYCAFSSVCKYDEKIPGYGKRELNRLSKDEALSRMMKELAGEDVPSDIRKEADQETGEAN